MKPPDHEEAKAAGDEIARLLQVEELDRDLYRGAGGGGLWGRVFGGQVVAQALCAAAASVGEGRVAHSLHAYFLRAGDPSHPIVFRVARDFDGRTFANRRVVAQQHGRPILNLAASFQLPEPGLAHAARMPEMPGPESALGMAEVLRAQGVDVSDLFAMRFAAFDLRGGHVEPRVADGSGLARQGGWLRIPRSLAGSDMMKRVGLAYVSDFGLISAAMLPHGMSFFAPDIQGASLDHAMWFHAEPPVEEWLLYVMESPWSGQGRGFSRGTIYDRAGRLIATTAQEGLMRRRPPPSGTDGG